MTPGPIAERRSPEKIVDQTEVHPIKLMLIQPAVGDGAPAPIPTGTVFRTPDGQPNVVTQSIRPVTAIAIRFGNAYGTVLVGLLTASLATNAITAPDFLHLLWKCMGLSLAGPVLSSLKDMLTIFGDLEKKYPLLTGKV